MGIYLKNAFYSGLPFFDVYTRILEAKKVLNQEAEANERVIFVKTWEEIADQLLFENHQTNKLRFCMPKRFSEISEMVIDKIKDAQNHRKIENALQEYDMECSVVLFPRDHSFCLGYLATNAESFFQLFMNSTHFSELSYADSPDLSFSSEKFTNSQRKELWESALNFNGEYHFKAKGLELEIVPSWRYVPDKEDPLEHTRTRYQRAHELAVKIVIKNKIHSLKKSDDSIHIEHAYHELLRRSKFDPQLTQPIRDLRKKLIPFIQTHRSWRSLEESNIQP